MLRGPRMPPGGQRRHRAGSVSRLSVGGAVPPWLGPGHHPTLQSGRGGGALGGHLQTPDHCAKTFGISFLIVTFTDARSKFPFPNRTPRSRTRGMDLQFTG